MAPFPEAEDMTVKRLYVALKRSDMQLLQMGAHKLHEKFHTGHKFELLDDLRQILSYVEEKEIPNDIKDLLTKTINDILTGQNPPAALTSTPTAALTEEFVPFEEEHKDVPAEVPSFQKEEQTENFIQDETGNKPQTAPVEPVIFTPREEFKPVQTELPPNPNEPEAVREPFSFSKPEEAPLKDESEIKEDVQPAKENTPPALVFEEPQKPVGEFEKPAFAGTQNTAAAEPQELSPAETQKPVEKFETPAPAEPQESAPAEPQKQAPATTPVILSEKESTLGNVAVFYDDKAPFIDFEKNKTYRSELDLISLNKEAHPLEAAAVVKNIVDVQTDEIGEILKMLNTIKGDVYFVTTSKSENVIKAFIENNVNFQIPLVTKNEPVGKVTELIPLFGLSNIFSCPRCGNKEYFGGFHNKVLSLQCNNCASPMYPDIYEAQNFETNSNPFYWTKGTKAFAKADVWILINPPLETTKALTADFIKSAFEVARPKKVYILSKETTKKEYYKQMFIEIDPNCVIKTEFITQDSLCEDFINSEMSTLKVTV